MIDYGLWARDERSALRQAAAELDAMVEMRYFELNPVAGRRYNQVINGHWYLTQEEFSNQDFAVTGNGCLQNTQR